MLYFIISFLTILFVGLNSLGPILNLELVKNGVQKLINENIPGSVYWDSVKLSLFRGSITVIGTEVKDEFSQSIGTIKTTYANISILPLLSKSLVFTEVEIDSPRIFLKRDGSGVLNIVSAFVDTQRLRKKDNVEDSELLRLIIQKSKIENGEFKYINTAQKLRCEIEEVNFNGLFELQGFKTDANLTLNSVSFVQGKKDIIADSIGLDINFFEMKLNSGELFLKMGEEFISLNSSFSNIISDSFQLNIELDSKLSLDRVEDLVEIGELGDGDILTQLILSGNVISPKLSLKTQFLGNSIYDLPIKKTDLELSLIERKLVINKFKVVDENGKIAFLKATSNVSNLFPKSFLNFDNLKSGLENTGYSINVFFDDFLAEWIIPKDKENRRLLKDYQAEISGDGVGVDPQKMLTNISLNLKTTLNKQIADGKLDVSLTPKISNGVVILDSTKIFYNSSKLLGVDGSYSIAKNEIDAKIKFDSISLEMIGVVIGFPKLSGFVSSQILLNGAITSPNITANIETQKLAYGRYILDSLNLSITHNSNLSDTKLIFETRGGVADIALNSKLNLFNSNSFSLLNDPTISLEIDSSKIYLDSLKIGLLGELNFSGEFVGFPLKQGDGKFNIWAEQLETSWTKPFDLNLPLSINDDKVILKNGEVEVDDGKIELNLLYSKNGDYKTAITSNYLNIDIVKLLQKSGVESGVKLDLTGEGNIKNPALNLSLEIDSLKVAGGVVEPILCSLTLRDNLVNFSSFGSLEGVANYSLKDGGFSTSLAVSDFIFTPWVRKIGIDSLEGVVSLSLLANGLANKLKNASLLIEELDLKNNAISHLDIDSLNITLSENGEINLDTSTINILNSDLKLYANLSSKKVIDAKISGDLPVKPLSNLITEISNGAGKINLDISAKGPIENPQLVGNVRLENISCLVEDLGQNLTDFSGDIEVTPSSLNIIGLNGKLDDGEFFVEGSGVYENGEITEVKCKLKMVDLPLLIPNTLDLRVAGYLDYKYSLSTNRLFGTVDFIDGYYYKDVQFFTLGKEQSVKKVSSSNIKKSIIPPINLDIKLRPMGEFFVENNIAELSVIPELTVTGSSVAPVLEGQARVTDGIITYGLTEFEIISGVIDFVDPYGVGFEVDIRAESEVEDWTVYLDVYQELGKELEFSFRSDPSLPDADIISLMIFGKTSEQMANDGAATDIMAQLMQNYMSGQISMDNLKLDFSEGVTVELEEELSRRLSTIYSVNMDRNKVVQQVGAGWKLIGNTSINGFADTEGNSGAALEVKFEKR